MDFLLILLGILTIALGFTSVNPGNKAVSPWLRRSIFLAIGAVLILLGILFRLHRQGKF